LVAVHLNPRGQVRFCNDGPVWQQGPDGGNPGGGDGDPAKNVPLSGRTSEGGGVSQVGGGHDFWAHDKSTETHVLSAGAYHDRFESYLGLRESGIVNLTDAGAVVSNVLQASFWRGNRHISLDFSATIYSLEDARFGDTITSLGQ